MGNTAKHVDLDIVLHWAGDEQGFDVSLGFDHPTDSSDMADFGDTRLQFDVDELAAAARERTEEAYADALTSMFFGDPKVERFLTTSLALQGGYPIHFRLVVDPAAPPAYQSIRWELLRDPNGLRLAAREDVCFSRYLSGSDWRQVTPLATEGTLRALVVAANPSDAADYGPDGWSDAALAEIDVGRELTIARDALAGMAVETLPNDAGGRPTLAQIAAKLRGGVDVLYVVAHGRIADGVGRILLEDDDGSTDEVDGARLAEHLVDLERRPTIAVLCSCQSAGPANDYQPNGTAPLTPFGPALARAGIPVVVAMQGNVTMATTARLMPAFFRELRRDGLPDRAMAAARSALDDRPDWWMPVLFSRLRRGRAWYRPRFGGAEAERFRYLRDRINADSCSPVLGSGVVAEGFMPGRETLAADWVRRRQLPIVRSSRADLAKVAQYVSVNGGMDMPGLQLSSYLRSYLRNDSPARSYDVDWSDRRPLADLVADLGRAWRAEQGPDDLTAVLAAQRLPIYITTGWTSLLEDALTEAGAEPIVRSFEWRARRRRARRTPGVDDLPEKMTGDRPLVYHLFGTLDDLDSIVLTEDDYFAWLRAWIKQVDKGSIPYCVGEALSARSLMFLGYSMDDWEFRVLFQAIKSFEGNEMLQSFQHIGVQLRPEASTVDPDAAQDYLETYFGGDHVDIYWGSCHDFLLDLRDSGQSA